MMTILDRPEDLALGYLLNQGMLRRDDRVTGVEYDEDLQVVVVRTERRTDFEAKLRKKTLTSGCAQGTAFGDLMEDFAEARLPASARAADHLALPPAAPDQHPADASTWKPAPSMAARSAGRTSRWSTWRMSAGTTRWTRSPAGCSATAATPDDKIFYTTGRLTSEMVIKTVRMGIPILVSRSRLHRLGRGAGAGGEPDPDRPLQGQALRRAGRRAAHRLRRRPGLCAGGKRQALAQEQREAMAADA